MTDKNGFTLLELIVVVAIIVFLIMLVILTFKIIKTLLVAYAEVILLTIFGPLQIALGVVVPGIGFGAWLRRLIASLAVFPLVGALFCLSY